MKKLILALFIIIVALPLIAKTDKIRKATPAEIADCNEVLTNMPSDKTLILKIWNNSKDFKNTNVRCAAQATAFKTWQTEVEDGKITRKNRAGETVTATMEDLAKITRLDRYFYADPVILQGIFNGTHHILDGRLKANDVAVPE